MHLWRRSNSTKWVHAFKTTRIHYSGHRKNGPLSPVTGRVVREKGQRRFNSVITLSASSVITLYCQNVAQQRGLELHRYMWGAVKFLIRSLKPRAVVLAALRERG